jgi:hypothetical protein
MAKRWIGVALLLAGCVGQASAQNPYLANQGAVAVQPEPIPFSAASAPADAPPMGAMPGPGQYCPPDAPNSLRGDAPNAWSDDKCYEPAAAYFALGFMSAMHQRTGHSPAAFLDTASAGIDTGLPIPSGAPVYGDLYDMSPRANRGVRTTLGYHWDTQAVEFSGYYLSQSNSAKTSAAPGSLDALFFNAPLGFEGDNGMWQQADVIRTSLQTALGSAEVNYRWWLGQDSNFSWSLGVRYLDLYERFKFYTGDDDLTVVDIHGNPDPTRQATYSVTTHNRILAPQLGLQWDKAINCWMAFTLSAKGAWGANYLDVNTLLVRGDGFEGFAGHRNNTLFSQLYETGFFLNLNVMENMRIRAGYNLLWVLDVAEATSQVDYNLANPEGRRNHSGSTLYYGPVLELNILF